MAVNAKTNKSKLIGYQLKFAIMLASKQHTLSPIRISLFGSGTGKCGALWGCVYARACVSVCTRCVRVLWGMSVGLLEMDAGRRVHSGHRTNLSGGGLDAG